MSAGGLWLGNGSVVVAVWCVATAIGRGVYFATNFSYSANATYSPPDGNGIKYVYQSLVLTGEFVRGAQSMIVPPTKTPAAAATGGGPAQTGSAQAGAAGTHTSIGQYDSVVDNVTTPSVFVVFYDTQAYPQYLISFN